MIKLEFHLPNGLSIIEIDYTHFRLDVFGVIIIIQYASMKKKRFKKILIQYIWIE